MAKTPYQGRANMKPAATPAKKPVMGLRKLPPEGRTMKPASGGLTYTTAKPTTVNVGDLAKQPPSPPRQLPPGMAADGSYTGLRSPWNTGAKSTGGVGMAPGGGPKVPPASGGMTQADGGRRGAPAGGSPKPVTRPKPIVAGKAHPNAQAVAHANANASFKRGAAKPKPKPKPKPKAAYKTNVESRRMTSQINEPKRRPAPKRESTKAAFLAKKMD